MKKYPLIYGLALTAFTTYVMLDTFVLPSTYGISVSEPDLSVFEEQDTQVTEAVTEAEQKTDHQPPSQSGTDTDSSSSGESGQSTGRHSPADHSSNSRPGERKHRENESSSDTQTDTQTDENAAMDIQAASAEEKTYSDENITISLKEYRVNDTTVYAADVSLSSAKYLKTALAKNTYGKNVTEKVSVMAEENDALLAINGDYYGAKESGYVIRNGVIYRENGSKDTDVLCIYTDGRFEITDSSEKTAQQLLDEGVWQAFSFGPALVEDGEVTVAAREEVGKAMASNPRTAIGIIDDLHYVFAVSDGRTSESEGLSLTQLAQFMQSLGCTTAYNLDGGGSSEMVFRGEIINNPTTSGRTISERSVSDIVYIG